MRLAIQLSSRRFTAGPAKGRHWFYIAATIGRTVWLQWWPNPIPNRRRLTIGYRA